MRNRTENRLAGINIQQIMEMVLVDKNRSLALSALEIGFLNASVDDSLICVSIILDGGLCMILLAKHKIHYQVSTDKFCPQ